MKTTPFTEKHISLGAKMHEFAGYNMPIEYSGIIDEHLTVCNAVGVFDVSHMGEFWVKGPNALAFLQKVTSNNVAALTPGKVQYTCFPNEEGGIVDDLLVYHYESEKYLLVVNASNIEKDWNWCISHNTEGAELENASDHMAQLAIQGPKALETLQKLTSVNLSDIPYYTFVVGELAGEKEVIISNTGYTGAGGFELYFYPEASEKIWNAVLIFGTACLVWTALYLDFTPVGSMVINGVSPRYYLPLIFPLSLIFINQKVRCSMKLENYQSLIAFLMLIGTGISIYCLMLA